MIHGIVNVYKEQGFTSHDVVAKLRGIVHQKKIGHTGTLDPDAEGVLPVCLGRATKVCDMLTDRDKTYEAVLLLGQETDTQDTSGTVLQTFDGELPDQGTVLSCIRSFQGEYDQVPPMYSALKVNGKKLYELAREGKTVERKSRRITIHRIEMLDVDLPRVTMSVTCSKGTYIRTLCHDIGEKLGCHGCMEHLVRTASGRFGIDTAYRLAEIEELAAKGRLEEILLPVDRMFEEYPEAVLNDVGERLAYNGNSLRQAHFGDLPETAKKTKAVRVYDRAGDFIGVYTYESRRNEFKIQKMFYEKRG
jgi:tRNA pseudouridine55 synthase